jgi:hypothetical protein
MASLSLDQNKVEDICKKYGVDFLGLFGSVGRGADRPDSDIDLLVRFSDKSTSSLVDMVRMEKELSLIAGRGVDLVTQEFLSSYFREQVLKEVKLIYGSA